MLRAFLMGVLALGATVLVLRGASPSSSLAPVPEPASHANVGAFVVRHLVLDLAADFEQRILAGTVELHLERRDAKATGLVLDTRDLLIKETEGAVGTNTWISCPFKLDPPTEILGSALRIILPPGANRVRITYQTSPNARALQWLTPAQTTGKRHPFLFTQAWAIQARSFIPLQDLPVVRFTYESTLRPPAGLVAVMAAEKLTGGRDEASGVFKFRMPQPIPSYLLALAIGELTFKSMGPRTGVWAEPSMVDAAAREFADTEQMMAATESIYGPYRWARYDLLVMPPSFPFGGMENPRLTFVSPTIIAGDKSLGSLVAHELAHSWSGNLVNNATWPDFWLNEGFTTYIERRIVEQVYGKARADMERVNGLRRLQESRATLAVARDKTLRPDFTGRDPDAAYSDVPYEQGALFLAFLEAKFGRPAFDRFLRAWFDQHAFQSATADEFIAFLKAELMGKQPESVTDAQLQEWLHTEGIPAFAILPEAGAFAEVKQACDAWLSGGAIGTLAAAAKAWSVQEWLHFVDALPRTLTTPQMAALDGQFRFTQSSNAALAQVWFRLAVAARYDAAYPALEDFMVQIGRRRLIVPLYRDLAAMPDGKTRARKIFSRARAGYHPVVQTAVADLLR
jgi:aminopeptidase N